MSLCLSIPFLMDSVNSFLTTRIYDATGDMATPWEISVGICLISFLSGLIVYRIYIRKATQRNIKDSLLSH